MLKHVQKQALMNCYAPSDSDLLIFPIMKLSGRDGNHRNSIRLNYTLHATQRDHVNGSDQSFYGPGGYFPIGKI